jgi:hypothetical protein
MADEAICIETPRIIKRRTITGAIAKGTILYFSADPNTVAASSTADQAFAGIATSEVTAAEFTAGVTEVPAAMDGVWDIKATAAANVLGEAVAIGGANLIVSADAADLLNGAFIGYLEETQSASEFCRVSLRGY